jgi:hypothetical protein
VGSERRTQVRDINSRIATQRVGHLLQLLDGRQGQIDKYPPLTRELASSAACTAEPFLARSVTKSLRSSQRIFK